MRRLAFAVVSALLFLVGFAEWQVRVVRAEYQEGRLSAAHSVRATALYLPARQLLFVDPGLVIATAFQLSRQPGPKDFVSSMRQAGQGLGLLRRVFLDPMTQSEWRNEAAFQALTLLVRMPWDSELARYASGLSMHLREALSRDNSATSDERLMIEELQELLAMRQTGMSAMESRQTAAPLDELGAWHIGLHELRLGFASCLKNPDPKLDAAWSALAIGFGQNWLRREWFWGWDAGLLQTVQASRTSADCERLAARAASMASMVSTAPDR